MNLFRYLEIVSFLLVAQDLIASESESWPGLTPYTFTPLPSTSYSISLVEKPVLQYTASDSTKTLQGCDSTTQCDLEGDPTDYDEVDIFDNVGAYAARYNNAGGCWGSPYCSKYYQTTRGEITDNDGNHCTALAMHFSTSANSSWTT